MGPEKPQGESGQVSVGGSGAEWQVTKFPSAKAEREELIAGLFVKAFEGYVACQSEPSLAPFGPPEQNRESDLDFSVKTATGDKLMELAEFAPLKQHGPKFENAPTSIDPTHKTPLVHELIQGKSAHQGGKDRFLVLYATEHAFKLDPFTVERLHRLLAVSPPNFDRVYYLSVHSVDAGSVSELYPGKPHHTFGGLSDEELDQINVYQPHPREMAPIARGSRAAKAKLAGARNEDDTN